MPKGRSPSLANALDFLLRGHAPSAAVSPLVSMPLHTARPLPTNSFGLHRYRRVLIAGSLLQVAWIKKALARILDACRLHQLMRVDRCPLALHTPPAGVSRWYGSSQGGGSSLISLITFARIACAAVFNCSSLKAVAGEASSANRRQRLAGRLRRSSASAAFQATSRAH
jgi:hypothetical protein